MTPLPLWLIRLCSLPQTSPEPPKPNPVRSPLSSPLRDLILQRIRESGPLTAAEFIDLAQRDITAHVDFTALQHDAEIAGLDRLGATDQTYFLMGLGIVERLDGSTDPISTARRRAATSLVLPEGLGGAQKVLVFGNNVGRPRLRGLSKTRLT